MSKKLAEQRQSMPDIVLEDSERKPAPFAPILAEDDPEANAIFERNLAEFIMQDPVGAAVDPDLSDEEIERLLKKYG